MIQISKNKQVWDIVDWVLEFEFLSPHEIG